MKQKIIVCSDNNKILENISSILKSNKIKFDIAHSYDVLLDLANKQKIKALPYKLIITDLHVNKQNGKNYFEQIVSENSYSNILAIYSHASYTTEWLEGVSKENSNIQFMKKPFDDIEFIQAVKASIKLHEEGFQTDGHTQCVTPSNVSDKINISNKRLLENISHEVRTPLSGIVGLANMLEKSKLSDVQENQVKSIMQSAESLLNIITDLIDFEDIQHQAVEISSKDFCFTDLIEGCVKLICAQAEYKEVDVNLCIGDEVPTFVHSDESKIRKVVWNLLNNAIKYTNYGNVTVFCDYEEIKKGNDNLIISIKDTGIGIDDKSQKNMFNKFTDSSSAYRSGGSGIGLSITKKILDAFGGEISVHSIVDEGSIFTVKIPVAEVMDKSMQLEFGQYTPLNLQKGLFICANKFTAQAIIPQFAKQNCYLDRYDTIRKARIKIQNTEEEIQWCILDDSVVDEDSIPLLKNLLLTCKQNGIKGLFLSQKQNVIDRLAEVGIHNILHKPCLERDIRHKLSYHSDTAKSSSFAPSLIPVDKLGKEKSLKVLLAEDNEINQMVISDMLKRNGHKVDIARHGKIAVDKALLNKYDVIFMDLQMPIMNGIEATKIIRAKDKLVPIVGMTSNIADSVKQECRLAGMDKYLTKPITERTLVSTIAEITDK